MKGSIEKWPSKSRMPKSANLNEQEKENVSPQAAGGSRAQLPQIQVSTAIETMGWFRLCCPMCVDGG